jgi:hypothetical protein
VQPLDPLVAAAGSEPLVQHLELGLDEVSHETLLPFDRTICR